MPHRIPYTARLSFRFEGTIVSHINSSLETEDLKPTSKELKGGTFKIREPSRFSVNQF